MGTTARSRPQAASRARASARGQGGGPDEPRDEYDLLTAMLLGLAVGAGVALLFRTGPKGRPIRGLMSAAGSGASLAGKYGGRGARWAGRQAGDGAGWVSDRAGALWDQLPREEIAENVGEYLESARETINDAVSRELGDLRKAMRRQRKRLGI